MSGDSLMRQTARRIADNAQGNIIVSPRNENCCFYLLPILIDFKTS